MKILHVITSIAPRYGGPSNGAMGLCKELAKQGHDVSIFTTNVDGNEDIDVPLNQPIQVSQLFNIHYFAVQKPRYYRFSLPLARALKSMVPKVDIVHIHALYSFPSLIAAYYSSKYGVPYIVIPHGVLNPFFQIRHRVRKTIYNLLLEKPCLNRASAIHFTTREEMELASSLKIKAQGIIVPNGLDLFKYKHLPEYGSFRKKFPDLTNKKIILFFSRLNFVKGLDILAHAFGKLARERDDVYLVLAGPNDDGYGKKVENWIVDEGVSDSAIFTGMLLGEEKLALLRDSDVFVLPSYSESFGIVVAEAMASGLPVIISNKVNIWREVQDAGAGLVTDCDSHQVAQAILKLLDNPTLCKEMGQNGRKLVEEKYTWTRVADQMIKVYEQILEKHRTSLSSNH